jgi:PmbA protein
MELVEKILDRCAAAGADMADVFNLFRKTLSISVRDGDVETIKKATPGGLAIRFYSGGKMAFAHSTDNSEKAIDDIVPRLAKLAQTTEQDEFARLSELQPYRSDLDIFDPAHANETLESKIEYLRRLEKLALKYDPLITKSNGVSYEEFITTRSLGNSQGVRLSYDATLYRIGISVVASKGGEMYPGEGSVFTRHFRNLPSPEKIVELFASKAVRLIGGTPIEGGDYEIIFKPSAGGSILWGLNYALNGSNAFKGSSFLSEKLGQTIGAAGLTVSDDPAMPGGMNSRPADDEGTASVKSILIDHGVLTGFMYDLKTAAKAKAASTSSSWRGEYSSYPEITPSNFYIAPGKDKLNDVIESCKKGIVVEDTQGWGLNGVTGQYSAGINGILVENGKKIRPVAEVTVAASAEELLMGIGAICDDISFYNDFNSPSIMVKKMKVGA